MMDNLTSNKSHKPCQSWAGQNGWSTASTQGPHLNPLPGSQHLSLGSSSNQRLSYDHLQASNQSCMSDLSTVSSRNDTHHSAMYKDSQICNNPSSTAQFAIPSASHIISFAQQSPHTLSMLLNANQEKHIPPPSLHQTNQAPQPCSSQNLQLPLPHNPYKVSFQRPLTDQGLPNRLQNLPISLPSCGQLVNASQATFEGAYVEFARVAGCTPNHASSPPQEQRQWIPSSHCSGAVNKSVPDAASHPDKEPLKEGNISPPACNERRLVLLHQRSQLLQQLAELDTLLESIPPEDSRKGQSPYTATQSQSVDHSSQCEETATSDAQQVQQSAAKSKSQSHPSSPASYDEQSETCDTPDDPMSAAESEKIENASVKSEDDSDPDYLPNRDGDLSDFPDGGSSDESSHSRPLTPTDEKLPLPGKTRAKSDCSSFKDKGVIPLKRIRATNWKKSSETVVLPTSGDLGISDGFKEVLSKMAYDDVTQAIMEDEVILQFGELLFNKHGSDLKKHDYIRQNLRQVARLVLEARKITPLEKLQDFFLPSSFPHVVSAVNVLAGYNPEKKTHSIPSLAIKLGYALQKICSIVEELLVQLREACGVPSKNPFLFGRPHSLSAYNGAACIRTYIKACGAKDPEALTVAKMQKHYTTMLQLINLDEKEANQILGPNNQVRSLRQDSSMQLDDVEMDSDDLRHEQTHGATTRANMTVPLKSVNSGKKGSQNNGKQKWEEAEILAVERHMMALIEGHKVPQKSDCIQCLEAEPEALRSRSWKGVKDYVRNRITALKRQSGTSKATSTNG
ncbi:hypothetical protein EPR50_G00054370 [Perca flavescens]|uniref:Uncharacterized protein n=1 Tax=Perca flavescens TaxID=8167 RepID=A0A484DCY4_PERFV|nr:hypothetical protein EPR50_G00054370 [Perca flavescens]